MKKRLPFSLLILLWLLPQTAGLASSWNGPIGQDRQDPAEAVLAHRREGYWAKTGGKFAFGLKQSLVSWMWPWAEAENPRYKTKWEGFCIGFGKIVPYTAGGLIQLATFPIPLDFPDMGKGLHSPHQKKSVGFAKRGTP